MVMGNPVVKRDIENLEKNRHLKFIKMYFMLM